MLPYTPEILRLSTEIPNLGCLPPPAVTVDAVSPICGSRIRLSALVRATRIADFAWQVEACALGQASAALIGPRAFGWGEKEFRYTAQALEKFLKLPEDLPHDLGWLAPLAAARSVPQRHGSVLLPLIVFQRALSSSTGSM